VGQNQVYQKLEMAMNKLEIGAKAPSWRLLDQNDKQVALKDLAGRNLLIFFYPKAMTSG
jgi:thioredoxin-dependent peroxiredoxin